MNFPKPEHLKEYLAVAFLILMAIAFVMSL